MSVDLVSDFTGEMRCPVGHSLTWKRGCVLDAEKHRVRVLEATLPPGVKEQVHSHPAYMIYVLEGGRYRNYASDGKTTEGELKTGDVLYREPLTHAAENIGDTTMHMILVELKK